MRAAKTEEEIVVVRVGKSGITEGLLSELDNVLRARGLVKVKLLKNFRDAYGVESGNKDEVAEKLAKALGAEVVEVRGYTIVLRRRRARGGAK
jgi:RNA-binding protein